MRQILIVPPSWPPILTIVIDTEEEFDWNAPFDPANNSVCNIDLQPLAQAILDKYGVVPTYVVDYPVASTPSAVTTLRGFLNEGRCEIGAHLHPWVNPPTEGPTDVRHSYPGNLPRSTEWKKLVALTDTITTNFGRHPTVYKAGRYGLGAATAATLESLNYTVDVSVVPHTNFSVDGGPDFSDMRPEPFMIGKGVCELPLSVHFVGGLARLGPSVFPYLQGTLARRLRLAGICTRLGLLERLRLSPEGHSLGDMIRQTRAAVAAGTRLFMLTYHSSSLLPGATAYVRDKREQTAFLRRLDDYLRFFMYDMSGRADTVHRVARSLMLGIADRD